MKFGFALFVCLLLAVCPLLKGCQTETKARQTLYLGAGPGLPRLLANLLARRFAGTDVRDTELLTRTVGDCCAAVSQWGLSSRELDMAVMCPDAARILVEKNADYVLAGPVLLSGEMLVRRVEDFADSAPIQRVGMAHQRSPQRALIRDILGDSVEIVEMLPAALPYALERGAVDAVVLDRLIAAQSPLHLVELVGATDAVPTQVLVLHRRLYETRDATLTTALRYAVSEANAELDRLPRPKHVTQGENSDWIKNSTRFVSPLDLP